MRSAIICLASTAAVLDVEAQFAPRFGGGFGSGLGYGQPMMGNGMGYRPSNNNFYAPQAPASFGAYQSNMGYSPYVSGASSYVPRATSSSAQRVQVLESESAVLSSVSTMAQTAATKQNSAVLESVAEVAQAASVATQVMADVEDENENGLSCCEEDTAFCAACKLGITVRAFCALDGIRWLKGCGFGAPASTCGVGVMSKDGSVCCDPDHCGNKCGGEGCRDGTMGGPNLCCASAIKAVGESCGDFNPPCVQGTGFVEGIRGLYDMQKELSVANSNAKKQRTAIVVKERFWDDGTAMDTDRGCNNYKTCGDCARGVESCSWDSRSGICGVFTGPSDCSSGLYYSPVMSRLYNTRFMNGLL